MKKAYITFAFAALAFAACKKDDCVTDQPNPEIPNEEELITTLNFTLTPQDGGDAVTFSFTDLDGDGGEAPELVAPSLAANTVYTASVEVLNESEDPAEDITEEVEEEAEEHQFFYQSDVASFMVTYTDQDANGNPIGLATSVETGVAASGELTITLIHEPIKEADGVASGLIANAGGEADIEVTFDLNVE